MKKTGTQRIAALCFEIAVPVLLLTPLGWAGSGQNPSCDLTLSASNVSLAWNQNFTFQAVTFILTKNSDGTCDFGVTFSRGGASDYNRKMTMGAATLPYQLSQDSTGSRVLKEVPDLASSNDFILASLPGASGSKATLTYYVQIPQTTTTSPVIKPSGTYNDTFVIKVYSGKNSASYTTPVDSKSVTINTFIPKIIDISLTPSGGHFDPNQISQILNFGPLPATNPLGFDLQVRSNAGYTISFSSQNNGVMKHTNLSLTSTVPYSLSVNTAVKNLSSSATTPVQVASGSGQTSLNGVASAISVMPGTVTNQMAGQYQDNITVTAATTE